MQSNRTIRAKQFLPFNALKGLQEALREKEKEMEYEERKYLAEETLNELDNIINRIENGSKVKIIYYNNHKYNEIAGIVTNIDSIKKKVEINKRENINICDIIEILKIIG